MRITVIVALFFVLSGCALMKQITNNGRRDQMTAEEREQARREHEHQYDGITEDDLVMKEGAPTRIENVASFKVYIYLVDHGITSHSRGIATPIGGSAFAHGSSSTMQHYEQKRFYFKAGKFVKWDEDEQ